MNGWLAEIYDRDRRGLYALALSVTRRPSAAEDAVHDAVVRLARKGAPPQGDARAYVFRSVRNAALDQLRAAKRGIQGKTFAAVGGDADDNNPGVSLFADPGPCPAEQTEQAEQNQRLMQAVESLPDAQRETIVMKVFGGLTFQEIADTQGEPLSTVSSRYQRGLARLKTQMEMHHAPAIP